MTNNTAKQWHVYGIETSVGCWIEDSDGRVNLRDPDVLALIVKAVNHHAELVAELQLLVTAIDEYAEPDNFALNQAWLNAKEFLAKL